MKQNNDTQNPSRRQFFKQTGGVAALVATGGIAPGHAFAEAQPESSLPSRAKNIIFLVSDGMSHGTLAMADQYRRLVDGRPSNWMGLYDRPGVRRGLMDMASANNLVTDSSAASSSWGCGRRVHNGSVNVHSDGEWFEPILPIARRHGLRTGLVTTATVTHATPAGFAANGERRGAEMDFAVQYLEREIDVILGGGSRLFLPNHREDERDLVADFVKKGYAHSSTREELVALPPEKERVLGLFGGGHVPFEIDRQNDPELLARVPSLAEMTETALRLLSLGDNGFIVQIEAARVDHAAHNNDLSGLVFDQLAFDDAIEVALRFADEHPDTLVIVTTDHGNANPGLNTGRHRGRDQLGRLRDFKTSLSRLAADLNSIEDPTSSIVKELVEAKTGISLSDNHAGMLVDRLQGEVPVHYHRMSGLHAVVGQILANTLQVGWVGNSHTSDYVELAAIGPGSEGVKAFNRNTELFTLMTGALGIHPFSGRKSGESTSRPDRRRPAFHSAKSAS